MANHKLNNSKNKKQCPESFKISYATKKAVMNAISNHPDKHKKLDYYKCKFCREYHLTKAGVQRNENSKLVRDIPGVHEKQNSLQT